MLSNSEKIVVISSTTNEWPQNHIDEKLNLMEKPITQAQQQALKCPRCDSSNTKFCYYNNYSLSQPRHFCKACKRYWTRGGTLRNVPVGGGCRKNKRVKRTVSSSSVTDGVSPTSVSQPHQINVSSTSAAHHTNPLFYNPCDINFRFPFNSGVSVAGENSFTDGGYDLPSRLDGLGLGFSSDVGFNVNPNSNTPLSSYSSIFGSSSSAATVTVTATPTATPAIASLLSSTLHQHKFINGGGKNSNHFQTLASFQGGLEDIKVEERQNRMEWNMACQNHLDQIGLSDPTVFWNPTSVGGAWLDQPNISSSVTSLI